MRSRMSAESQLFCNTLKSIFGRIARYLLRPGQRYFDHPICELHEHIVRFILLELSSVLILLLVFF